MLPAAAVLGLVHGDVGGAHQRFDARSVVGRDGDADRSADVDAVGAELERLGDGDDHPARDPLDLVGRLDLGEEDREFVAGKPRKQRPAARVAAELAIDDHAQPVRDHDQQLVAAGMAEAVVDHLEPVEVDEQHRRPGAARPPRRAVCPPPSGNGAGWEARSPDRTCPAHGRSRSRRGPRRTRCRPPPRAWDAFSEAPAAPER